MNFNIIVSYFLIINIIGAATNCIDKNKAKHNKWRVRESTLWIIGILGGAPFSYITMKTIRHKTKHTLFMVIMPLLAAIQIVAFIILSLKMGG